MERVKLVQKNDFTIYAYGEKDNSKCTISYCVYLVDPDGGFSTTEVVTRKDIMVKKNPLDFIYNFVGEFDANDIETALHNLKRYMKELSIKPRIANDKVGTKKMYDKLCKYIKEKQVPNDFNKIWIEDEHGFIKTTHMDIVVKDLSGLGYNKNEMLKVLDTMGVLIYNPGKRGCNKKLPNRTTVYCYKVKLKKCEEETIKQEKVEECA